jgi:hypothetical protein
LKTTLSVR